MSKLLNDSSVPKSVPRKWIKINELLKGKQSEKKNIKFCKIYPVLRSDFF